MDIAALEIGLFPSTEGIVADMRFAPSSTATDQVLGRSLSVPLDPSQLCARVLDPIAYAKTLTAMLFHEPQMLNAWHHVRTYCDTIALPLHIRLRISNDLPILHDIRWELLCDPFTGEDLSRSGRIWISRALDRIDSTQRDRPTIGMVRTLVALSNPADLERCGLAPIPPQVGFHAAQSLLPLPTMLIDGSAEHYASLQTISRGLWRGSGILVVFAHGVRRDGETLLGLQSDEGDLQMVSTTEFVEVIGNLPRLPIAIILVSCMAGGIGSGCDDGMTTLGGRLAQRGVGAVLALAGFAQMRITDRFVPTFLAALAENGDILHALGFARAMLTEDRWSPRLWLNTRDGQLWDNAHGQRWLMGAGLWG